MEEFAQAAALILTDPTNLVILVGACALSFIMGLLPGLSATEAMIILLPFSFAMELNQSMIMLSSAYAAGFVGGSITSIIFGIPGSATNLTTMLDGHALHKQGRTIFAVSAASTASVFAGLLSLVLVVLLMPLMEPISLLFGPAEWFAFVIFGLVVLSFSGDVQPLRGLVSGALGLLAGTIGLSVVNGVPRYTFGIVDLWGGIPIIPAFIALYPLTEALWMATGREAKMAPGGAEGSGTELLRSKGQVLEGIVETFRRTDTVLFAGAMGWLIGIIPGVGATLANILGYYVVKDMARDKSQFGKGDIRGLIAAESSNNSSIGGALIPCLALGIPGSIATAVLLGVFMINGVQPGSNIFSENLTVTWVIILAIALSTIISSGFVLAGAWRIAKVVGRLSPYSVAPMIVFIGFVSVILVRHNPADLIFAAALTVLGYLMKLYGFSRMSFVIALMLGPIVENSFFQALSIGRGSYTIFFSSVISWLIWGSVAGCFLLHLRRMIRESDSSVSQGEHR